MRGFRTSGAVTGSGPCISARNDIGRPPVGGLPFDAGECDHATARATRTAERAPPPRSLAQEERDMLEEPTSLRIDDPGVRALFTERARFQAWLDVEAALAQAQGGPGILPESAAREIRA